MSMTFSLFYSLNIYPELFAHLEDITQSFLLIFGKGSCADELYIINRCLNIYVL